MHQPACITARAIPSSRQLRQSHRDAHVGEEIESDPAERFVFTTVRVGAGGRLFFFLEIVPCDRSVPLRNQTLRFTKGSEAAGRAQRTRGTRPSYDALLQELLASAQQYLQALRENNSPPPDLREAWEAFYRACDPLVRRTVAACCNGRAEVDDCIQEAWAEITAKLTRFEYDADRGAFEGWLRIVVHRAACRYARRDHRQTTGRIDQDLAGVKCPRLLGPLTATQQEELRASVRQTLDAFRTNVSITAFRILIMSAVDGQTSTEIGKLLGLTPGHVRVLRHRIVQKFRHFVATQSGLVEALGVSQPKTTPTPERRRNQQSPEPLNRFLQNRQDFL